jgi:hypothetical protein
MDRPELVVREHQRHEDRPLGERVAHPVRADLPDSVHGQVRHLEAFRFQPLAGVEHGAVLRLARDDVVPLLPVHPRRAQDRQPVGLGRAGRKDDLLVGRAHGGRDLVPRLVHRRLRLPPEHVVAPPRCRTSA